MHAGQSPSELVAKASLSPAGTIGAVSTDVSNYDKNYQPPQQSQQQQRMQPHNHNQSPSNLRLIIPTSSHSVSVKVTPDLTQEKPADDVPLYQQGQILSSRHSDAREISLAVSNNKVGVVANIFDFPSSREGLLANEMLTEQESERPNDTIEGGGEIPVNIAQTLQQRGMSKNLANLSQMMGSSSSRNMKGKSIASKVQANLISAVSIREESAEGSLSGSFGISSPLRSINTPINTNYNDHNHNNNISVNGSTGNANDGNFGQIASNNLQHKVSLSVASSSQSPSPSPVRRKDNSNRVFPSELSIYKSKQLSAFSQSQMRSVEEEVDQQHSLNDSVNLNYQAGSSRRDRNNSSSQISSFAAGGVMSSPKKQLAATGGKFFNFFKQNFGNSGTAAAITGAGSGVAGAASAAAEVTPPKLIAMMGQQNPQLSSVGSSVQFGGSQPSGSNQNNQISTAASAGNGSGNNASMNWNFVKKLAKVKKFIDSIKTANLYQSFYKVNDTHLQLISDKTDFSMLLRDLANGDPTVHGVHGVRGVKFLRKNTRSLTGTTTAPGTNISGNTTITPAGTTTVQSGQGNVSSNNNNNRSKSVNSLGLFEIVVMGVLVKFMRNAWLLGSSWVEELVGIMPMFLPHQPLLIWFHVATFVISLITLVFVPLMWSFSLTIDLWSWEFIVLFILPFLLFIVEIFLSLNTAYYEEGDIQVDRKKIVIQYAKTNLFFDLVSTVAFYFLYVEEAFVCAYLVMLRLPKIKSYRREINEYFYLQQRSNTMYTLVNLILTVMIVAHYFACGFNYVAVIEESRSAENNGSWIQVLNIDSTNWVSRYVNSIYFSFITMVTVGFGDIKPTTDSEKIYVTLVALISSLIFAYTVNTIGTVFQEIAQQEAEYKSQKYHLSVYMRSRSINQRLQTRAMKYLDHMIHKQLESPEKGQEILKKMSKKIRDEINKDFFGKILLDSKMFKFNFSEQFLKDLTISMKEIICRPGETIFSANEIDNRIFFINKGDVELFLEKSSKKNDLDIYSYDVLTQGDIFGELSFFTQKLRETGAKSLSVSHLVYCTFEDFILVLKQYPKDFEKFCQMKDEVMNYGELLNTRCAVCQKFRHSIVDCPYIHVKTRKANVIHRHVRSIPNERSKHERKKSEKVRTILNSQSIRSSLRKIRREYVEQARFHEDANNGMDWNEGGSTFHNIRSSRFKSNNSQMKGMLSSVTTETAFEMKKLSDKKFFKGTPRIFYDAEAESIAIFHEDEEEFLFEQSDNDSDRYDDEEEEDDDDDDEEEDDETNSESENNREQNAMYQLEQIDSDEEGNYTGDEQAGINSSGEHEGNHNKIGMKYDFERADAFKEDQFDLGVQQNRSIDAALVIGANYDIEQDSIKHDYDSRESPVNASSGNHRQTRKSFAQSMKVVEVATAATVAGRGGVARAALAATAAKNMRRSFSEDEFEKDGIGAVAATREGNEERVGKGSNNIFGGNGNASATSLLRLGSIGRVGFQKRNSGSRSSLTTSSERIGGLRRQKTILSLKHILDSAQPTTQLAGVVGAATVAAGVQLMSHQPIPSIDDRYFNTKTEFDSEKDFTSAFAAAASGFPTPAVGEYESEDIIRERSHSEEENNNGQIDVLEKSYKIPNQLAFKNSVFSLKLAGMANVKKNEKKQQGGEVGNSETAQEINSFLSINAADDKAIYRITMNSAAVAAAAAADGQDYSYSESSHGAISSSRILPGSKSGEKQQIQSKSTNRILPPKSDSKGNLASELRSNRNITSKKGQLGNGAFENSSGLARSMDSSDSSIGSNSLGMRNSQGANVNVALLNDPVSEFITSSTRKVVAQKRPEQLLITTANSNSNSNNNSQSNSNNPSASGSQKFHRQKSINSPNIEGLAGPPQLVLKTQRGKKPTFKQETTNALQAPQAIASQDTEVEGKSRAKKKKIQTTIVTSGEMNSLKRQTTMSQSIIKNNYHVLAIPTIESNIHGKSLGSIDITTRTNFNNAEQIFSNSIEPATPNSRKLRKQSNVVSNPLGLVSATKPPSDKRISLLSQNFNPLPLTLPSQNTTSFQSMTRASTVGFKQPQISHQLPIPQQQQLQLPNTNNNQSNSIGFPSINVNMPTALAVAAVTTTTTTTTPSIEFNLNHNSNNNVLNQQIAGVDDMNSPQGNGTTAALVGGTTALTTHAAHMGGGESGVSSNNRVMFLYDFDRMNEYTNYFPHNNCSLVCQNKKKVVNRKSYFTNKKILGQSSRNLFPKLTQLSAHQSPRGLVVPGVGVDNSNSNINNNNNNNGISLQLPSLHSFRQSSFGPSRLLQTVLSAKQAAGIMSGSTIVKPSSQSMSSQELSPSFAQQKAKPRRIMDSLMNSKNESVFRLARKAGQKFPLSNPETKSASEMIEVGTPSISAVQIQQSKGQFSNNQSASESDAMRISKGKQDESGSGKRTSLDVKSELYSIQQSFGSQGLRTLEDTPILTPQVIEGGAVVSGNGQKNLLLSQRLHSIAEMPASKSSLDNQETPKVAPLPTEIHFNDTNRLETMEADLITPSNKSS